MANDRNDTGRTDVPDRNPDPITGTPGSHPVGTGVGAAAAGAAGTAIGAAAGAAAGSVIPGPGTVVGGAVGAVVGALAGGLAGKGVAEAINPTEEDAYWRGELQNRPYYKPGTAYDEYEPAYRYGYTTAAMHHGRNWDDIENDLGRDWDSARGTSRMDWDRAKLATRDAWDRATTRIRDSSNIRGQNQPD